MEDNLINSLRGQPFYLDQSGQLLGGYEDADDAGLNAESDSLISAEKDDRDHISAARSSNLRIVDVPLAPRTASLTDGPTRPTTHSRTRAIALAERSIWCSSGHLLAVLIVPNTTG
ncbi:hypothetical protein NLM31_08380 [Bradyrhizobium sp. CCGUVB4N]|uniref:hypothetical protein n=1 Tax=Bradyrhizobium sp. CCGUVB4N TaxID=2949631 RepID=UPI0020B3ECF5|nr:hypothetical protein [Bradyrhizobium sp. CCGUVB4N]MCP3380386.1 hypothetical protein [Bradyrhizobium sp. CCGUVB4N]